MVKKGLPLKRSVECALEPESSAKKLRTSDSISLDAPQQFNSKTINSSASEEAQIPPHLRRRTDGMVT